MTFTPQMPNQDVRLMRSFLGWAGMGVMPSQERAKATMEVVEAYDGTAYADALKPVRTIASEIGSGVMVSLAACRAAQQSLMYAANRESLRDAPDAQNLEAPRG